MWLPTPQIILADSSHGIGEGVYLFERGVDVRCDPDAFVFRVDDWRRDDPPLVPQQGDGLGGRNRGDLHGANGAGLPGIKARVNPDVRIVLQFLDPPVSEVAETRRLPIGADAFVETERLGNGVVVCGGMGAD